MVARGIPALVWLALSAGIVGPAQERAEIAARETSAISGRVVDAVSGRPVPGAEVQLSRQPYVPSLPSAVTDATGAFTIRNLPGGEYTLWSSKGGYLTGAHAKRRANGSGIPVQVGEGERVTDVTIVTWPEASIAGTVIDERGLPVAAVPIAALKRRRWGDAFRYDTAGGYATTDDRGEYRIDGLSAGEYIVVVGATTESRVVGPPRSDWYGPAGPGETGVSSFPRSAYLMDPSGRTALLPNGATPPGPDRRGRWRSYVTSFAGGAGLESARVIRLAAGDARDHVDVEMRVAPAVRVSGRIVGPTGPVPGALVRLVPEGWSGPPHLARHLANAAADGSFAFLLVPSGAYSLVAHRRVPPLSDVTIGPAGGLAIPMDDYLLSDDERLTLRIPIGVGDADITDLDLMLRPGTRITATSVFDSASGPPPAALKSATASLRGIEPYDSFEFPSGAFLKHEGGGRFSGRAPPGRYVIDSSSTGLPGFHLKSVSRAGRELTAGQLDVGTEDVVDLVLTFADRSAALRGRVTGERGGGVSHATVVLFPADRTMWALEPTPPGSPWRIRSQRVDRAGYSMDRLDAGEYFVAAVDDALLEDWPSPALLGRLSAIATRVRLDDGEQRTLDLRVRTAGNVVQDDSRPHVVQAFRPVEWLAGSLEGLHYATISATAAVAANVAAQQPPRDATPSAAGPANSVLRGRVTDAGGRPLGRTVITVAGVQPGGARTAITDDDGRYSIAQLPAGRFIVWATRPGFLPAKFGEDAAGAVESRVVLSGATRADANFVLTPGAAISGTVVDAAGDPVVSSRVHVRRAVRDGGRRTWRFMSGTTTDARGAFRLWGLPAGEYVIFSAEQQRNDDSVGPGAAAVTVAAGEERRDVALVRMPPPPKVRVEGTALGPDGLPIRGTRVQLVSAATGLDLWSPATNPDGSFVFRSVPPGRYVAVAHASTFRPTPGGGGSANYWGTTELQVDGNGPITIAITLAPGVTLSGRVALLSTGRPADFSRVRVSLVSMDLPQHLVAGNMGGGVGRDGTLTITGVPPGQFLVGVELFGVMRDWTVQSALLGEVDALDAPVRIASADVAGLTVTLTDRPTRLAGLVRDERGEPALPFVIAYSVDPKKWPAPSKRWVRAARPDTRGEFEILGLPAGAYRIALVERLPAGATGDSAYLRVLRPEASVTLGEGEQVRREFVWRRR